MLCGNGTTHGSPNPLSPTIPTSPPSQALFLPAVAESENALAGKLLLADRERLGTVLQRGRRRWARAEWDTSCSRVGRRKPTPGAHSGL